MRLLIQRVTEASVSIENRVHASIQKGLLVLIGICKSDSITDIPWLAKKLVELRIFEDNAGKMNLSVQDIQGEILLISQFTLYAVCRRGRRPDFIDAAPPIQADELYRAFIAEMNKYDLAVKTGVFAACMQVQLVNDGPVTIILDSKETK
jgi:D-tyrosyl-tRNA(Tyr) deacylase